MTVTLKTPDEIEKMRIAGRLAADVPVSYTHLTLPTTPYV